MIRVLTASSLVHLRAPAPPGLRVEGQIRNVDAELKKVEMVFDSGVRQQQRHCRWFLVAPCR
jgi:hypothetical protein